MQRIYPLLFVFLWSTGFIGAKYGLPYAEPLSFLFVRYLAVIALMTAIALLTRAPWPKAPMQWVHIGVSGLLVHAVYLGGVFIAIKQGLPAGITALVVGMQPLLTALGAGWLLGERVVGRQWLGLALGFVGVALVVSGKFGDTGGARPDAGAGPVRPARHHCRHLVPEALLRPLRPAHRLDLSSSCRRRWPPCR